MDVASVIIFLSGHGPEGKRVVHSDMGSGMVLTRSYLFINFLLQRTEV